jgi:diguanylate cyclase (GGDEF)-like protein
MLSLAHCSVRRSVGAFSIVLGVLLAASWTASRIATDHLLYESATLTARNWAQYLARNVVDLEQIAAGEQPSVASLAFLQAAGRAGEVFRYEIFNRDGYAQLVAGRDRIAFVDLADLNPDAALSIKSRRAIVDAQEGQSAEEPVYFAHAYVPIISDGRPVAVVAAYVDQTEQRDSFHRAFLTAVLTLCLLTVLSFAIPAVAWYRRTREKQQADRRIRFLAHHDVLTGLDNRARLIEKLDRALAAVPPPTLGLAIHFLDLDHFKDVNDALGHDGGDVLLKTIAERLRAETRAEDVVARIGGDEFVVVQRDVAGKDQAQRFADRLVAALREPITHNEHEITATVSIGIAMAPSDGTTPDRLLKSADLALYKSKADGRNCVRLFLPEMDAELQSRLELERTIRDAVTHERFELHYQPLFEVSNRRLTGFEALIRLPDGNGKLIPPMTFIPLAEEMRLIDKIGAWVLREACKTAATWPDGLTVAVNLSPAQFASGSISETVAGALQETGLAPGRLELEITESLLLGDNETILLELRNLKAMGVSIAMDDFGTGYSSLSYLWKFPFDKIKIDRSFMQGSGDSNRDARTVVKTIIALGRELHMRVTVEGVETADQAEFLSEANGDQAQGYYFGRPTPAGKIASEFLGSLAHQPRIHAEERHAA